jgi:hypothetical protein
MFSYDMLGSCTPNPGVLELTLLNCWFNVTDWRQILIWPALSKSRSAQFCIAGTDIETSERRRTADNLQLASVVRNNLGWSYGWLVTGLGRRESAKEWMHAWI